MVDKALLHEEVVAGRVLLAVEAAGRVLLAVEAGRPEQADVDSPVMVAGRTVDRKVVQEGTVVGCNVVDKVLQEAWLDPVSSEPFLCQSESRLPQEQSISQLDR